MNTNNTAKLQSIITEYVPNPDQYLVEAVSLKDLEDKVIRVTNIALDVSIGVPVKLVEEHSVNEIVAFVTGLTNVKGTP